jgi:hypothetical protein
MNLQVWDVLLLAAVSALVLLMAYLRHPRWKAFMLNLPIPFSISVMAVGRPIDASNLAALGLYLGYMYAVYLLHARLRTPIVPAILASAAGYTLVGSLLGGRIPPTEAVFWPAAAAVLLAGVALHRLTADRPEPGHRSPIPLPMKLPLTVALVLGILLIKSRLQGFMTLFPVVSVFGSYESRRSLWTNCRQVPRILLTVGPLIMIARLAQRWMSLGPALLVGWGGFLLLMIPVTVTLFRSTRAEAQDDASDPEG